MDDDGREALNVPSWFRAGCKALIALVIGTALTVGGAYACWLLIPGWTGVVVAQAIGCFAGVGIAAYWTLTLARTLDRQMSR